MKKLSAITIAVLSFSLFTPCFAQVTLCGLTAIGGTNNVGTVFSITSTGTYSVIANLNATFAANPEGSLLYASDGNFYGSSMDGGYQDSCTIFRCTPTGTLYTMINLDSVWGSSMPEGNGLIEAMDHNLYGMTTEGGIGGNGVLFKLKLTGQYTAVHFFNGGPTDGMSPMGSLIQTADSNLWGMTSMGGTLGYGTIFRCSPSGNFTTMYNFDNVNGAMPYGDLLLANDGNFYGLTYAGGTHGYGTLFRYSVLGGYTKLVDFDSLNGEYPSGSLIQATDGNLYGLTSFNNADTGISNTYTGGTLFRCSLSGNLTTLVNFTGPNGALPMGTLLQASDNLLYGMTTLGGAHDSGTVFKCTLSGTLTTIFSFDSTTGMMPYYAKLIEPENTLSVKNISDANSFTIYPNPFHNSTNIVLNSGGAHYLELSDITGRNLQQLEFSGNQYTLSGEGLSAGMYFIRIFDENKSLICTSKIVVQ